MQLDRLCRLPRIGILILPCARSAHSATGHESCSRDRVWDVATFIDRQLSGAYGSGARLYRDGPFAKAKPELGYQLPLTPREFFRAGIAAANEWSRKTYGEDFDRLAPPAREAALKAMETGKAEFPGFSSRMFFNALLTITMEGFFADPIYGGNRDMAAWKMIGYPGLPATYREDIKKYFGKKYDKQPQSIADFS